MSPPEVFGRHADAFAEALGEGALVAEAVGEGDFDDFLLGLQEGFGGFLHADAEHQLVKAGAIHGKTDARAAQIEDGALTIPDFNATIAHALGLPLEEVVLAPNGRPFKVADKGKPVMGIFA